MSKEIMTKRLKEIDDAIAQTNYNIQQLVAQLNNLRGSRDECNYWLNQPDPSEVRAGAADVENCSKEHEHDDVSCAAA